MKQMHNFLEELVVAIVLMVLLGVLLNPLGTFMPTYLEMTLLAALVVFFGAFTSFVWRENPKDERERFHRMSADRAAYLAGSGLLLLALVIQGFSHQVDSWIIVSLGIMVVAKAVGLIYMKIKL